MATFRAEQWLIASAKADNVKEAVHGEGVKEELEGLAGQPDALALHGAGAVHQEDQLRALGRVAEPRRQGEQEDGAAVSVLAVPPLQHDLW